MRSRDVVLWWGGGWGENHKEINIMRGITSVQIMHYERGIHLKCHLINSNASPVREDATGQLSRALSEGGRKWCWNDDNISICDTSQ